MSWKHALILWGLGAALAATGCQKQSSDELAGEEAGPSHGLTEAQASEVLVKVGDRTITVGEFADRLASQSPYLQARFESPERRREFLENLVRYELLVYEAKRLGYEDKPEIQRARRTALTQQLIKREVDEKLKLSEISDEEIQKVYDANPEEYDRPAQVRASAILIKDRDKADRILAKAKGMDITQFRALAREESEDLNAARNGGDYQFFGADAKGVPPEAVRDAAFTLAKVGQVFSKPVKSPDGYYIVMLTGKRAALKRSFEQAKRAIRHKLSREKKEAAMDALLENLREEIPVEINYEALEDVQVDVPDFPK